METSRNAAIRVKLQIGKVDLSPHQIADYANLTRVCRSIRTEFISYLLGQVDIEIELDFIDRYAICFDRAFRHCKGSLIVTFDRLWTNKCTELFPLLRLSNDAPKLTICFIPSRKTLSLPNDLTLAHDLNLLIDLCRQNKKLRQHLDESITTVTFYPRNRFEDNFGERCLRNEPCIQVEFSKQSKQKWMEGTHSLNDLQTFLAETGLDGLTTVDVRVGLTSMRNEKRGKGLQTQEERDVIDWLLGRSSQVPSM
ncbi:uncharacterized protein K460DRAFT_279200 [Cucurbitaria berberidis CBS 394.84]|uniref:Uncharacterized protein n=1 Tax=Cucurbitaria berberidis CBS 394.84 TaxID=1168544 RepID=A0A9P4GP64_9PLEO|nr:uncharacterized protein K460DRAFT_279200 [Cucurbitaria berberidis CBS 394.84]KAF1849029.1 hypothetical protein K460DRAFT_279200 [Cucurbitaria berberidis CBS 394.84]